MPNETERSFYPRVLALVTAAVRAVAVVAPVPLERKRWTHLVEHPSAVTCAVMLGSLITAIVQGTLAGVSFALVGLSSPVVFGVHAMLAATHQLGGHIRVGG